MKFTLKAILFFCSFCLIISCGKDQETIDNLEHEVQEIKLSDRSYRDDNEALYFSLEPKTETSSSRDVIDPFIIKINNVLYDLNQEEEFVTQLAHQLGIPDWQNSIIDTDKLMWTPLYKGQELSGIYGFLIINDVLYFKPYLGSYLEIMSGIVESDNVDIPLSVMSYFETGSYSGLITQEEASTRDCPPTPCGRVKVVDPITGGTANYACICSGIPAPTGCCNESNTGDGEIEDGGAAEAGGFNILQWISLLNSWYNGGGVIPTGGDGGGPRAKKRAKLIQDLSNEQLVLSYLLDYFDAQISEDGVSPIELLLAGNPQISNPIYLYLNGFYPVAVVPQNALDLINLLIEHPLLALSQIDIEQILTFEPELIGDISTFLDAHPNDPLALQIVLDFIDLQQCDTTAPCIHTDYENEFEDIYTFYSNISTTEKDWLDHPDNALHKVMIWKNITNYAGDAEAQEFIDDHFSQLKANPEYKAFVESTFNWNGIMWSIAKELVGDKVIDLVWDFIVPAKADDIRDAFKAAKNGDWLEFFVESSKIVLNNTPWGKWIKAYDLVDQIHDFYKKVEKIWDKVGGFAENVIEQMWNIVNKYPKSMRTNTKLIEGIAKTVKRGLKSVDDMVTHAGVPYINSNTVTHIFRGDGFSSGRHHISAVVADPSIQITHIIDKGDDFYRASLRKLGDPPLTMDDKNFFPDDWDEYQVIDAIKEAYNSNPSESIKSTVVFDGIFNGRTIKIVKKNGIIETAYLK